MSRILTLPCGCTLECWGKHQFPGTAVCEEGRRLQAETLEQQHRSVLTGEAKRHAWLTASRRYRAHFLPPAGDPEANGARDA